MTAFTFPQPGERRNTSAVPVPDLYFRRITTPMGRWLRWIVVIEAPWGNYSPLAAFHFLGYAEEYAALIQAEFQGDGLYDAVTIIEVV